ncbi:MAG: vitamin K epoxide reductase family protein [Candidatus Woesearchaeota archaeon]
MHRYLKEKHSYMAIVIISIICIALSITIQIEKKNYSANQEGICSAITGSNGCEAVQTSEYASTFGVDNPIFGIIGFMLLSALSAAYILWNNNLIKYAILAGSIIASSVALWFLYLQRFVLHKYCIFCIFVDILSLVILGISIYALRYHRLKK